MLDLAQNLLSLSEKMLQLATENDWDKVDEVQTQRAKLITEIGQFSVESMPEQASLQFEEILKNCQQLETRCQTLAALQHQKLSAEFGKIKRGNAMRKAYGG